MSKRFDLTEIKRIDNLVKSTYHNADATAASSHIQLELSDLISKSSGKGKPRIVIDGFPTNLDEAKRFESEVSSTP